MTHTIIFNQNKQTETCSGYTLLIENEIGVTVCMDISTDKATDLRVKYNAKMLPLTWSNKENTYIARWEF